MNAADKLIFERDSLIRPILTLTSLGSYSGENRKVSNLEGHFGEPSIRIKIQLLPPFHRELVCLAHLSPTRHTQRKPFHAEVLGDPDTFTPSPVRPGPG